EAEEQEAQHRDASSDPAAATDLGEEAAARAAMSSEPPGAPEAAPADPPASRAAPELARAGDPAAAAEGEAQALTPIPLTHAVGMEAVPAAPPLLVPEMPEGTSAAVPEPVPEHGMAAAPIAASAAYDGGAPLEVTPTAPEQEAVVAEAQPADAAPAAGQIATKPAESAREAREGREGRERRGGREERGRDGERKARDGREGREGKEGRDGRERERGDHRRNGHTGHGREERKKESKNIQDLLKEGQEVIVQVAKDPIGTKGARITSHISLPGRHLVFMPTVDHIGISRRIEKDGERRRLRDIVDRMRPEGTGFIVRTVAENVEAPKLEADIRFLIQVWNEIIRTKDKVGAPALLHPDLDLILRATRDLFTAEVGKLVIDDRDEYERILRFVREQAPHLESSIESYQGDEPIFDAYGIEQELKRASQRKVWLKSGGYIIMDQAEALTAIDVNSGRYVGKKNLEETITKINVEAAKEIVYQLRLRNIGGIIIIDFIDMDKPQNREKVFKALQDALGRDKAKTNVLKISELGLVEMTRKRVRESVTRMMAEPCGYCEGKGHVRSKVTVAYEIFREIRRDAPSFQEPVLVVNCHPEVARILQGEDRDELRYLMDRFNKTIQVKPQTGYHQEQFDIYGRQDRGERGEKEKGGERDRGERDERRGRGGRGQGGRGGGQPAAVAPEASGAPGEGPEATSGKAR
ncbi:MAG: Rne/Rng family ribonuclease, partial [Anaeromyxobacteraceae bacterium]